jgi:hypothetical protein
MSESQDTPDFGQSYLPDDGRDQGVRINDTAQQQAALGSPTIDAVADNNTRSKNFVKGQSGWQLRPDGAEFNDDITVRGFQMVKSFTAFEAIAAGAPVSMWFNGANVPLYDNSASGASSAVEATHTVSYTVGSGTNRILTVFVSDNSTGVTGITYNGVAMTQVDSLHSSQNKSWILIAPASGAHNLVITKGTSASSINWIIYSHTGAKQSSQPAAHQATVATSVAVTPVADGEIVVGCAFTVDTITSTSGIPNHQNSLAVGSAYAMAAGDTTGLQGGLSYTVTETGGTGCAIFLLTIAPATAVTLDGSYCTNASAAVAGYKSKLVGFADAAIAKDAMGDIVLGGIADALTGLTPGSYYYLQDTPGTIGTSAGTVTVKTGFALTTAQLLVTNIW